jgi:hypothetical protein
MATGTRATNLLLAALVSGVAGIGGIGLGLVGVSETVYFGAGGAFALMLLAGGSQRHPDGLHPARIELARCRRSGQPADVLVVELPASTSIAGRRPTRECASTVSSVLRVTDGVSMVPSLGGRGLCAVLESDGGTRSAIDRRLRNACGNEIRVAWARTPDDGVALESLLEVAVSRLPLPEPERQSGRSLRPLPVQRFFSRGLRANRGMRSVH